MTEDEVGRMSGAYRRARQFAIRRREEEHDRYYRDRRGRMYQESGVSLHRLAEKAYLNSLYGKCVDEIRGKNKIKLPKVTLEDLKCVD